MITLPRMFTSNYFLGSKESFFETKLTFRGPVISCEDG